MLSSLLATGLKRLDQPIRLHTYYLLAASLAIAYTLHLFPLDFFLGTAGFWFDTHTDPTQHITGMWAFVQDDWSFPLLYTSLLNAPEGVSVAFTDSIPIAALLFKPIYPYLPPGSHYFGAWVFGCYLAQGLAGAAAAAGFGGRTPAAAASGTLFAVMMPALMIRIPHAALLAQYMLILILLYYYRLSTRHIPPVTFIIRGIGLLLLAVTIHPYLLAMLYTLYGAALLAEMVCVRDRRSLGIASTGLLLPLPLLLLLLYCLGYLSLANGAPPAETGYTESSMNLLSPIFGTPLAPSGVLPHDGLVLDATGMQIDGHNYLGLGLLLMLVYITCRQPRQALAFLKTHWVMALVMLGLFAYAVSNTVYLGDRIILDYALPEYIQPLTQTFRGSGRFFWPVGYALLLIGIGYFLTRPNPAYRAILLLLLTLQYIDTRPHRDYLAEAAYRTPNFAYDRALWDQRVQQATAVYLLPTYGCGASGADALFLQYFTALHAVPFNSGFVARVSSKCNEKQAVLHRPRQAGELFIFVNEQYPLGKLRLAMSGHYQQWCSSEAIGIVCQVPENQAIK